MIYKHEHNKNEGSAIGQRTVKEAIELAHSVNCECFFPDDYELFLDIDSKNPHAYNSISNVRVRLAENNLLIMSELLTVSKGGNRHVYLKINKQLGVRSRVALQAALGSDPVKEALTILRLEEGCEPEAAIALFEKSVYAVSVEQWRKEWSDSGTK